MKKNLLHSYSLPYQNAIDLINCYNNYLMGEPLGNNHSVNTFFTNKIAPLTNLYSDIKFEIEEHDSNSRQLSRGVTINIFGIGGK